jgi:hemerythrin-like domain-containing protein
MRTLNGVLFDELPFPAGHDLLHYFSMCHAEILERCRQLEEIAPASNSSSSPARGSKVEFEQKLASLQRFFGESSAVHHDDEELLFFPMLRAVIVENELGNDMQSLINTLYADHIAIDQLWHSVRTILENLRVGRKVEDISDVGRFAALHRHHIGREESGILPFARRYLNAAQLSELGNAIASRHSALRRAADEAASVPHTNGKGPPS